MSSTPPLPSLDEQYDAVVVGGGAAGLAGAVALARMRRRVLVVDAGQPRNAPADGVHNLLGREGTPPLELLAAGRAELAGYGGVVVDGRVTSLRRSSGEGEPLRFAVVLEDGRTTTARRLLLAHSGTDVLPDVPGLRELWGSRVLHCPFCHGWEVRATASRAVAVLSTGPMTAHAATLWRSVADRVVVLSHTGPDVEAGQRQELEAAGVEFVAGEVVSLEPVGHDDGGVRVRLASGAQLEVAAVVAASQVRVDTTLTGQLGVAVADVEVMVPREREVPPFVAATGAVTVDPTGLTSAPGVWAAGNAAAPMAVVPAVTAAGMQAGAAMTMDLAREDVAAALLLQGAAR